MKGCRGSGDHSHSHTYVVGEYKDQTHIIRGRSITVRGVKVRKCGCQEYWCISQMHELLLSKPKKKIVTWCPKVKRWK